MSLKSLFANILGFLGLSIVLIAAQIYLFGNNQQQSSLNHHDSTPGRLLSEDNGGFLDLLISSSAPGTPSLASLTRANKYISYMEIPLPPRLFKMARNQGRSPITLQFGMKAPESMYESERILDAFSSNQDVSSNFLINFWGPTITFIVVILLAVVFNLLHRLAYKKQWDTAYSLFGILKKIFQWNFVLILIATSAEDVFYYAALQFKGMDAGSGAAIFGILECFVMMIVVIAFLVGIFVLIQKQRYTKKFVQSHEASDTYADFLDKYQSLQILNTGFKDENLSTHLFYLIYIAKNVLSAILGGFLDIAPIVQIILQVLLNSLMLTYVLCLQPLKKSINMIQLILIEGISLFTNFAMVAAVEEGAKNEQDTDTGSSVGDFVIVGNVLINILIIYFLIHKIVVEGKAIYRLQKSQVKMSKLTWLRILPIILQQGGLGFENIELPVISLNDIKNKRFTPLSNASRSEITKVGEEPESPLRRLNVTGHTESAFTFPALHNSPDYIRDSQFSDTSAGSPVHPFKSIGSPDSPLPLFKVQSYNLSEQVAEALEDQKVVEIGLSQNTIELMRARLTEKNKYAKVKRALVNVHKKKLGSSTILKALEAKPLLQLNLKNKSIEQAKPQNGAPLIQIKSSKNPENMPSVALKQKEAVEEDIEPQNEIQNEVGPQAPTDKELFNDIEQGLMELDEAQNLAEKEEVERAEAREGRVREKDENIQNFQHTDDDFDVMAEIEVNPSDENKDAGVYQNQENQYEHQADQQNDASEPLFKVEPEQEQERERSEQRNGNGNGSFNEDQQQPISATFRNIEEPNKTQSNFEKLTLNEEDMAAGPQSREDIDAEDNEQDENKRSKSLSKSPTNRRARLRGNKQESPKVPSQMKRLEASPFKSNPGKRR